MGTGSSDAITGGGGNQSKLFAAQMFVTPGTNINAAGTNQAPLQAGTLLSNQTGSTFFSDNGNGLLRCEAGLWLLLHGNIVFTGNITRYSARARFTLNGSPLTQEARTSYIRNASGHQSSSFHMSELVAVVNGDELGFQVDRLGGPINAVNTDGGALIAHVVEVV